MSLIAQSCYTIRNESLRSSLAVGLWQDRHEKKQEEIQILYVEKFNSQEKNTGQQLHHRGTGCQLVGMLWEKPGCHIWGMPSSTMDTLNPTSLGYKIPI